MRSRSTYPDSRRSLDDGRTRPATVSRPTVGRREVLADRRARRKAPRRGVPGGRTRCRRARRPRASRSRPRAGRDPDDAARDAARAAQGPQEHVLALPLEAGEPDDLAGAQIEVDLPGARPEPDPGGAEHRLRRARALGMGVTGVGQVLGARHQPDEFGRSDLAAGACRDRLARAHDGHPVADLLHLVHAMGDEDRARPLRREPPDDGEQPVAGGDVERGGRFVEDKDRRPPDERACDAASLPVAERELLDRTPEVRGGPGQLEQGLGRALDPLATRDGVPVERVDAEPEVVEDRARRDDEDLLEDRDDPEPERLPRRADGGERPARDLDRPAIGAVDAGQHLDERALARPVLAHDRVHLARAQVEAARPNGLRRAEGLRQVDRPQRERHRCVERVRAAHASTVVPPVAAPSEGTATGSGFLRTPSPCARGGRTASPSRSRCSASSAAARRFPGS